MALDSIGAVLGQFYVENQEFVWIMIPIALLWIKAVVKMLKATLSLFVALFAMLLAVAAVVYGSLTFAGIG